MWKTTLVFCVGVLMVALMPLLIQEKDKMLVDDGVTMLSEKELPEETLSSLPTDLPSNTVLRTDNGPNHHSVSMGVSQTSLRGTEKDGGYQLNTEGDLIVNAELKHRFDYYLSLYGERTLDDIEQLIRNDISHTLTGAAEEQALHLLESYLDYRRALVSVEDSFPSNGLSTDFSAQSLERFRHQLRALEMARLQFFSPVDASAFFGADLQYDYLMLEKLSLRQNGFLTEEQKQQQLAALAENSEEARFLRSQQHSLDTLQRSREWARQGVSDEQIYQLQAQNFGSEAAQRLQTVRQKRAVLQQTLSDYLAQKSSIQQNSSFSAPEKAEMLERLKQRLFSESEQRRLPALEAMATM